jgi:hypothetical protein
MLADKLDLLTDKPLTERLDPAQKEKIREQLSGLDGLAKLDDDEAKKRLDALHEALKDQGESLARAGYRWPGQNAGRGAAPLGLIASQMNPFKNGPPAEAAKAVEERLAK